MEYTNKIIAGDCLTVMRSIADNSVDVTFADPPFNLKKKYNGYIDSREFEEYLHWCQQWIEQMVRITKPTGSIFVHNIPRWLTYYASFLNTVADFRHWISWSAPTSPMGKSLQPAHYGILFYAKDIKQNKCYELRSPHKRDRKSKYLSKDYGGKKAGLHPFGPLVSDVWTDIHRVKHNKYRDAHPCQLPIHLLERLILMSSDEGDTVLDPFMGTGTTALAAKRLGRNYIGIELDAKYVEIAKNKLSQEMSDSKIGDTWVSFFLRKVATLRNIDWELVAPYFIIPKDPKQIDVTEIELNQEIDEIKGMRHLSRRVARKKADRPSKKSLVSPLSQDRTLFETNREPA